MGLDLIQLKELVITPTLEKIQLNSPSATNLLAGTAIIESDLRYVKQLNGPALSLFQIEPLTYKDITKRINEHYKRIRDRCLSVLMFEYFPPDAEWLIGNLTGATIIARLKYYLDPEPLPRADDAKGMAVYWKKIYNTPLGKGDIDKATRAFKCAILNLPFHG